MAERDRVEQRYLRQDIDFWLLYLYLCTFPVVRSLFLLGQNPQYSPQQRKEKH